MHGPPRAYDTAISGIADNHWPDPQSQSFVQNLLLDLIANGLLDTRSADRVRRAQAELGTRIDTVLIELGMLPEPILVAWLAKHMGCPLLTVSDLPPSPVGADRLDQDFLRENQILPLSETETTFEIAVGDPFNRTSVEALAYYLDKQVTVRLADATLFKTGFETVYENGVVTTDEAERSDPSAAVQTDLQRLRDHASEAPIIRLVNRVVVSAVRARASDIHLEANGDGMDVRFRVDGTMLDSEQIPLDLAPAAVSRIKILAGLDIAERRLPQDGRIKTTVDGRSIDMRCATTPVLDGESVVIRIFDTQNAKLELAALGFNRRTQEFFERALANPHGIVLVTGPTGSGKTTTLYAALDVLNDRTRKIFTVEDPVEFELDGINQMPVNPGLGLDFARALRSILRQDPDAILIGEMRDQETARIAVQSALTGHMVLSTLHTNSAAASITRLRDLGLENYLLASTLNGVVAQRLVRRLCEKCAIDADGTDPQLSLLLSLVGDATDGSIEQRKGSLGCEKCLGTGFLGRTCISETLVITDAVRSLIAENAPESEIARAALNEGMQTLVEDAVNKVLEGQTTAAEALRVVRLI